MCGQDSQKSYTHANKAKRIPVIWEKVFQSVTTINGPLALLSTVGREASPAQCCVVLLEALAGDDSSELRRPSRISSRTLVLTLS